MDCNWTKNFMLKKNKAKPLNLNTELHLKGQSMKDVIFSSEGKVLIEVVKFSCRVW